MTKFWQFCIILIPGLVVGIIWNRMTLVIPVVAACTFLASTIVRTDKDLGKKDEQDFD